MRRLDPVRGRLEVAEAASEFSGAVTVGVPKSHQRRSVPLPAFLLADLELLIRGKSPEDLIFTAPGGGPLRNSNFRRDVLDPAAAAVGLPGLRPHELRHTAASLAVAAGANIKAVQQMLGHASAAMTLDVYAGLFADDLDAVAERLDAAVSARVLPESADLLRTRRLQEPQRPLPGDRERGRDLR